MNDILFILLFFFLIVSTLANPNVIKLSQPKAKSDTKAKQTVVVSINDKQQFFVGTNSVPVDSLKPNISRAIAKAQDAEPTAAVDWAAIPVVPRCASGTPFITFFTPTQILTLAREAGFREVQHVSADTLTQRYFAGRADGLRPPSNSEELLIATT